MKISVRIYEPMIKRLQKMHIRVRTDVWNLWDGTHKHISLPDIAGRQTGVRAARVEGV